jgi:hypothetical protein
MTILAPAQGAQRLRLDQLHIWETLGYGMLIHFIEQDLGASATSMNSNWTRALDMGHLGVRQRRRFAARTWR